MTTPTVKETAIAPHGCEAASLPGMDESCKHCGSLRHVPGDPATYCEPARVEYNRADAFLTFLTTAMETR